MLRESHRQGIEPATCKSQVQRPTTEPPRNILLLCRTGIALESSYMQSRHDNMLETVQYIDVTRITYVFLSICDFKRAGDFTT